MRFSSSWHLAPSVQRYKLAKVSKRGATAAVVLRLCLQSWGVRVRIAIA